MRIATIIFTSLTAGALGAWLALATYGHFRQAAYFQSLLPDDLQAFYVIATEPRTPPLRLIAGMLPACSVAALRVSPDSAERIAATETGKWSETPVPERWLAGRRGLARINDRVPEPLLDIASQPGAYYSKQNGVRILVVPEHRLAVLSACGES